MPVTGEIADRISLLELEVSLLRDGHRLMVLSSRLCLLLGSACGFLESLWYCGRGHLILLFWWVTFLIGIRESECPLVCVEEANTRIRVRNYAVPRYFTPEHESHSPPER
jgi:hypothetical protein